MTVYKAPSGRWRAQHNRVSLGTFDTKRQASDAVARHIAGGRKPRDRTTISEFRETWLKIKAGEVRESTLRHYRMNTAQFAASHGDRPIADWSPLDCAAWYADHPWQLDELKRMFRAAVDLEVIARDPWRSFKKRSGKRVLPSGWITIDGVNRLAETARSVGGTDPRQPMMGDLMAAMILTAAWTCIRPGELFALHPEDVDFQAGELTVRRSVNNKTGVVDLTKSGEERVVVIPGPALDAIKHALPARSFIWDEPPVTLFANADGRVWRGPSWGYWWKTITTAAGFAGTDLYELRHLGATQLLEAGCSVEDVADQMGHRDGGKLVARVYGHPDKRYSRQRIRAAMDHLESQRATRESTRGQAAAQ